MNRRDQKTASQIPAAVQVARKLSRWRIRGSQRLLNLFACLGMLDRVVQYNLPRGIRFDVPLFRYCWDQHDVENYERPLVSAFCNRIESMSDIVLFDCGADIGIFSALVCSRTSRIGRVVAFEPNPDASEFLIRNLSRLPIPSQANVKAVSSFTGRGHLEAPAYDSTDHGRFLVRGDNNDSVEIVTVDSLGVRGGDIAIKIDVEGGEFEVLKGASETIASARNCVMTLEAHPLVAKRTKRDPSECLRFLNSLRPFRFSVAETAAPLASDLVIAPGEVKILNIVGWTSEAK